MDDESAFRRKVAAALRDLARQVDALDTDALDWRISDGVLHVEFEDGGVVVLSQQVPTREIWLSAERRAWHFRARADDGAGDAAWVERDNGEALGAVLSGIFERALGNPVRLDG
jgi:iron donor protein CyaY